jgi:hypothetical protein
MKFRHHRSTLDESMRTVINVADADELSSTLRLTYPDLTGDIAIKPYGYDDRIEWDTHLVTIGGNAVGFTDGPERRSEE